MAPDAPDILARFARAGGLFVGPDGNQADTGPNIANTGQQFLSRLQNIRALILDWDGVFSDGIKRADSGSHFGEADSMGLNLLRFAAYLRHGQLLPVAIITGENNPTAQDFAKRERLHAIYRGVADKAAAMEHFCQVHNLRSEQVGVVFDDANDLSMLPEAGLRLQVSRPAGVLFAEYTARHGLCDYQTANPGGQNAVREICELLMGLLGVFDEVMLARTTRNSRYLAYWEARQAGETVAYRQDSDRIVQI